LWYQPSLPAPVASPSPVASSLLLMYVRTKLPPTSWMTFTLIQVPWMFSASTTLPGTFRKVPPPVL
jgi:hypothetical protein